MANPNTASNAEAPLTPTVQRSRWRSTFAAFEIKNYRWFFLALCGNFAAMNIQMFIRGWLVYEITASYEKLGWMTAAGGLVGLLAAPLGGVVADRVRQKKVVLQISGVANALITFWIAALIYRGELIFEHLLVSSILQGLVMNAMMPARQAFTKDIVGLNRLTNAIGLSTSGMNTARLLLPGLAGGLVAALGGGNGNIDPAQWVYLLMAGLYLWSAALMSFIHVSDKADADMPTGSMLVELRLGFRYVLDTPIYLHAARVQLRHGVFQLNLFHAAAWLCERRLSSGAGSAWIIDLDLRYWFAPRLALHRLVRKSASSPDPVMGGWHHGH